MRCEAPLEHSFRPSYSTQHAVQPLRSRHRRSRHPCGCHTCSSRPVRHRIYSVLQQRPERVKPRCCQPPRSLGRRRPRCDRSGGYHLQPYHCHRGRFLCLLRPACLLHQ